MGDGVADEGERDQEQHDGGGNDDLYGFSALGKDTASGELLQSLHIDVTAAQIAEPDEALRQQAFDRAGLELQRTLDSFARLFSRVTLSRLVVATDTSDAFTDYVRELLYVPVVRLRIEDCIDFTGAELDSGLTPTTVSPIAIGAALRRT